MSWRSSNARSAGSSAWRQALAPLRQEANIKGFASSENLKSCMDALKAVEGDALDHELVEDLSFLVQQALGPSPSAGYASSGQLQKDTSAAAALCRLLQSVASSGRLRLHAPAANLTLGALRRWSDAAFDAAPVTAGGKDVGATDGSSAGAPAGAGDSQSGTPWAAVGGEGGTLGAPAPAAHNLQLEALGALAALLPEHLGALSEHERAAQLAALQSLLVPVALQQRAGASSGRALSDLLEPQCLALTALAGCCAVRAGGAGGAASSIHSGSGGHGVGASAQGGAGASSCALSSEEVVSLIAAAASLLQTCASSRTRPVEDGSHSRMYAALLRALTAAMGAGAAAAGSGGGGGGGGAGGGGAAGSEATRQAWVTRAGVIVEGLQRLLTYGVQASLTAPAAASGSASSASGTAAASGIGAVAAGARGAESGVGGGGGRSYRPPHLRRRESNADGGWSDSDVSDSEHFSGPASTPRGGGAASTSGEAGGAGAGVTVDRFRSSRVRLAALGCVMAMAKADTRALQPHWPALLPLQSPLAPRPLTPHLLTALLYDPLVKVRAMAASTIASLVDGPAPRAILAVAEAPPPQRHSAAASRAAKGATVAAGPPASGSGFGSGSKVSTSSNGSSGSGSGSSSSGPAITTTIGPLPVRGFLTLSMSLGQLLLGAHAGLLHAVGNEPSTLVLPGVLRALCVMIAATPYERLPPEVLPETVRVLRARWAQLCASAAASGGGVLSLSAAGVAGGELAPIHAAYLACLAECFSTKQPIAGLAAYLSPQQRISHPHPHPPQYKTQPAAHISAAGGGCGDAAASDGTGGGGGGGGGGAAQLVSELLLLGQDGSASALLRIEALGALKGLAQHYTFAMPPDAWEAVRGTATVGLSPAAPPASPRGARPGSGPSGPPTRTSSSSSLGGAAGVAGGGSSWRSSAQPQQRVPSGPSAPAPQAGGATPEDKAAQLSVKLVSEYLAALARQYGMSRTDAAAAAAAGDPDLPAAAPPPPPSPGVVPLAAAPQRQQQLRLQLAGAAGAAGVAGALSPASVASEEERGAGVARLAGMWGEAVSLLVPAATSHSSFMVRSVGLTCLGEVPEPVFSSLPPALQQQVLALLSAAAAADPVAATRAAACKALGAAAAFPAVLAHAGLSGQVSRALAGCLRDTVLSVRIAASWAVANLCDAHRRRLLEAAAAPAVAGLSDERAASHDLASTSASPRPQASPRGKAAAASPQGSRHAGPAASISAAAASSSRSAAALLEAHHYAQVGALCAAAITATQDTDKVRANGIRAVGNLLSFLTPDMAPGLAAAAAAAGTGHGGGADSNGAGGTGRGGFGGSPAAQQRPIGHADGGSELRPQGGWSSGRGRGGRGQPQPPQPPHAPGSGGGAANAGGGGGSVQLDGWLDNALTCLQSSLTTGGMKVQWNACYAAHGLLRNGPLLPHPRVGARVAQLLLLLVMLMRESANFKIRTHAAAALAALPTREGYGDVLADALLVVAAALEGLSNGAGGAAAPPAPPAPPASGKAGGGGGAAAAEAAAGELGGDGEADGKFPNYRYAAGLTAQLRATLLHLLALAAPADGRRVREALARRADFLHGVMREQVLEAVQPLRAAMAAAASAGSSLDAAAPLPVDPFGLSSFGSGPGRGASPRDAAGAWGLAGLLEGLSLQGSGLLDLRASPSPSVLSPAPSPRKAGGGGASGRASATGLPSSGAVNDSAVPAAAGHSKAASAGAAPGAAAGGAAGAAAGGCTRAGKPLLSVEVAHVGSGLGLAAGPVVDETQRAAVAKLAALSAPLRGFEGLLQQFGPGSEAVLRDVQAAVARLPLPGAAGGL